MWQLEADSQACRVVGLSGQTVSMWTVKSLISLLIHSSLIALSTLRRNQRAMAIALGTAVALVISSGCVGLSEVGFEWARSSPSALAQGLVWPVNSTGGEAASPAADEPASGDEAGSADASSEGTTEKPQSPFSNGLGLDLPPELSQLFAVEGGDRIERAPVRLDGKTLLQVAAIANEGTDLTTISPAEERAREIEQRLKQVATQPYNEDTLKITWNWVNNYPLISASIMAPEKTPPNESFEPSNPRAPEADSSDPEAESEADDTIPLGDLLTVTTLDVHRSWLTTDISDVKALEDRMADLADEWTQTIRDGLLRFKYERSPSYLIQQTQLACGLLIAIITLSYSLSRPQKHLKKKQKRFVAEAEETDKRLSASVEQTRPKGVDTSLLVEEQIKQRQRQDFNRLNRRVLQLGQVAVWASGIFVMLGLFPYTRWLQVFLLRSLQIPGKLTLVVILAYLATRLSGILIDRSFVLLQHSPQFLVKNSPRRVLRFSTFSSVTKSVVTLLLLVVAFFVALHLLGVNVAPLIAGAGLLGFAISFAAQNLIRDLINGFLILIEDQYGVGDVVILGDVAGFVESMGLRITQLRNEEGRLITVPNGSITVVQNLTKEWSRVDLMIDVAHSADIDKAIALIKEVAEAMSTETHWGDLILETPQMLGVDQLNHVGATVRIWIKTKPLKQWDVAREYRRRLKIAFDQNGIDIGMPQQSIRFSTALDLSRQRTGSYANGYGTYGSESPNRHSGVHPTPSTDATQDKSTTSEISF